MTKINDEIKQIDNMESKTTRIALTVVAVVLLFAGPTYIPYVMVELLQLNYFAAIGTGAVLFIVGIIMMLYLAHKKVLT